MCQNLVMQLFNCNLNDTFAPPKWDTNVAKLADLLARKQAYIASACNIRSKFRHSPYRGCGEIGRRTRLRI